MLGKGTKSLEKKNISRRQSHDVGIYNYNVSVVIG
jgi:hypothetical protein